MCGIAGWLIRPKVFNSDDLNRLLSAIAHRGPDDSGTYIDEQIGVALGHKRLSIIDLSSAGRQPMVNPQNGDVLVFNGEIYNYREIRSALEARGMQFRSKSDTEVLLNAFQCWGVNCIKYVRGMFAFAVWRPKDQALYLFRDPMGIKPLYYWTPRSGELVFSSEIKAFLQLRTFQAKLDRNALGQFLEFGYCFEPERSMFARVCRLPPGCLLELRVGKEPQIHRYFSPKLCSDEQGKEQDVEQHLLETMRLVVRQHLLADVPVGCLLSGGIDSSLVAALAAQTGSIRTISMGFADSSLIDERPYAAAVARYIGSEHEEVLITPSAIMDSLPEAVGCFDDLFADWGTLTTRLLYKKCRERGIKVVIVGEGADELFGGYSIFHRSYQNRPTELWLLALYRLYAGRRYGSYYSRFRSIMREYLSLTNGDRFGALRLFESRNQLPNNYVMKVDKASMSVSVEARVPYLDQRVAEIAYRIPRGQLLSKNIEKRILRTIARRHRLLPDEIIERRKHGASIAPNWIEESPRFRRHAEEAILDRGGWTTALGLDRAMRDYFLNNRYGYSFPRPVSIFQNLAWRLLLLETWSRHYRLAPNVC
jgi:asparagine synthase (glutamine-hydrolysing)